MPGPDDLASERQREEEVAREIRPLVLGRLRSGDEPLGISAAIAERHAVDPRKAYKWVTIMAETYERRRKRLVALGLVLLWVGILAVALTAGLSILVTSAAGSWLPGAAIGAPVALTGGVLIRVAARLVKKLD